MTTATRQRIFEAAESLLQEGKRPTQQLVRERVGSGSLTTINRALNEWWESLSQRLSQQNQGYDLPEPVLRLSNRLWNESLGYARREFMQHSESAEQVIADLKEELLNERQSHSERLKELSELVSNQQQHNSQLERDISELRAALNLSQEECFRLTRDQSKLSTSNTSEELVHAQVRITMQQEQIQALTDKNQKLISENAELKLKLSQR